jgi:hypothetical protein
MVAFKNEVNNNHRIRMNTLIANNNTKMKLYVTLKKVQCLSLWILFMTISISIVWMKLASFNSWNSVDLIIYVSTWCVHSSRISITLNHWFTYFILSKFKQTDKSWNMKPFDILPFPVNDFIFFLRKIIFYDFLESTVWLWDIFKKCIKC